MLNRSRIGVFFVSLLLVFIILFSSVSNSMLSYDHSEPVISVKTGDESIKASQYPFSDHYPSVTEYYNWFSNLTASYPEICSRIKYGESFEGRELYVMKISDNVDVNEDEPEVLIDGGLHAREWSGPQVASYFLWRLVQEYDSNDTIHWLVDNREIFVAPMLNPDGYYYDGNGDYASRNSWRKNRNDTTPTTSVGVDLNRNWDISWEDGVDDATASTYHGESPFSEPETGDYSDWILSRDIQSYQNLHSYAGTLLIPWCYSSSPSPHDSWYRAMADDMTSRTSIMGDGSSHYSYGQPDEEIGYSAPGGANDWVYNETGANGLCFEIETGGDGFYPTTDKIMTINNDLDEALIYQTRIADADLGDGDDWKYPPEPYLLYGTVTDDGSPLSGATIKLINNATEEKLEVISDENGFYQFDLATLVENSYSEGDPFTLAVGGTSDYIDVGSEWGKRVDLEYTEPPQQSISLQAGGENDGWNFISSRLIPENPRIDRLLSDINGSYDKVWTRKTSYREQTHVHELFYDDVESGSGGWTVSGTEPLWHIEDNRSSSPTHSWAYNDGVDYDMGTATNGSLTSPWVNVSGYGGLTLNYQDWVETESYSGYDTYTLEIRSDLDPWTTIYDDYQSSTTWDENSFELGSYVSDGASEIQVRFGFDSVDDVNNNYEGWYIDDVRITGETTELIAGNTSWLSYNPGRADKFNDLFYVEETMGFWVHVTSDVVLDISGISPGNTDIKLSPGWNMVGYPSSDTQNNGLPTEIDKVGYFSVDGEYNLKYDSSPSDFTFQPGEGYMIHNPTDTIVEWTVEG